MTQRQKQCPRFAAGSANGVRASREPPAIAGEENTEAIRFTDV